MLNRIGVTTIVALFLPTFAAYAQDIKEFGPLFSSHDTLNVEIEAPFQTLARVRSNIDEISGKFRFTANDGSPVEFDVALRARGNRRLNPDVCTFPPLRVNFVKSQTKDTLFDKQDKIKMVTHCRNNSRSYDQSVISEYLAYRMFNLLTDASFAVRLLKIRYVFTDDNRIIESFAILIEHKDRLGKRLGAAPLDTARVAASSLRPADLNLASVFQYFIGNTDFSPVATAPNEACCHNQALLVSDEELDFTVPFDFDQAGLIDAPHASPNPRFGLRSARTRLYRGRCANNHMLPATLNLFREQRQAIADLTDDQQELSNGARRKMMSFVDKFYKTIDNPKRVEKEFVKACI